MTRAQAIMLQVGRELVARHKTWRAACSPDVTIGHRWKVYWDCMRIWEIYLRLRSELYGPVPRRFDPWR